MVTPVLATFVGGIIATIIFLIVTAKERQRGRRFFASRIRGWLDDKVVRFEKWVVESSSHFVKYILQLNWYYSIHSVLKTMLKMTTATYVYIENVFERNRTRAKQLRSEKRQLNELNHLHQMAQHKEETSLSPSEQQKLRNKNLEGKH